MQENKGLFWDFAISGDTIWKVSDSSICICESGTACLELDSREFPLTQDDLFIVFAGDLLRVRDSSQSFSLKVMSIREDFIYNVNIPSFTRTYIYIKKRRHAPLDKTQKECILKMYADMKAYAQREGRFFTREISEHLSTALIYEIMDVYKHLESLDDEPFTNRDRIYFEFISLVEKNCRSERSVSFYADALCISPRYLLQICKDVSSQSPKRCIDDFVILNAKMMLAQTELSVSMISDKMNFPSPSFFVRYFREQTGMTPHRYRRTSEEAI